MYNFALRAHCNINDDSQQNESSEQRDVENEIQILYILYHKRNLYIYKNARLIVGIRYMFKRFKIFLILVNIYFFVKMNYLL